MGKMLIYCGLFPLFIKIITSSLIVLKKDKSGRRGKLGECRPNPHIKCYTKNKMCEWLISATIKAIEKTKENGERYGE